MTSPPKPMVIRADAGARMGTGHVMRSLALAQGWQDSGGEVLFVTATDSATVEDRLRTENMQLAAAPHPPGSDEDARHTAQLAQSRGAQWIVVDGYQFGGNYQRALKEAGAKLLAIDDHGHADHYWADFVLNQNPYANEASYSSREPYTRLLLGARYALLRREFSAWRDWQRTIPQVARTVLVSLGGGDPGGVILKLVAAIEQLGIDDLEVVLVLEVKSPCYKELPAALDRSRVRFRLQEVVSNMPKVMAGADLAIGAAGGMSWERAFMGLPSAVLVLADNQKPVAEHLASAAVATNLGWHQDIDSRELGRQLDELIRDPHKRETMSAAGQRLVDGEGVDRLMMHLCGSRLRLRNARRDDRRLIWQWANESTTRAMSFQEAHISWETHVEWFEGKLRDPGALIYLGIDEHDTPIGQVRFDSSEDTATISVAVAADQRAAGYGTLLITLGVEEAFGRLGCAKVSAFIKAHNIASIKAFQKCGFEKVETCRRGEHMALHYQLTRTTRARK